MIELYAVIEHPEGIDAARAATEAVDFVVDGSAEPQAIVTRAEDDDEAGVLRRLLLFVAELGSVLAAVQLGRELCWRGCGHAGATAVGRLRFRLTCAAHWIDHLPSPRFGIRSGTMISCHADARIQPRGTLTSQTQPGPRSPT